MNEFTALFEVLEDLKSKYGTDEEMTPRERAQAIVDLNNACEGDLHLKDGYNCDKCKNKGYSEYLNEDGFAVHVPCECQKVRTAIYRIKSSGLGDIFKDLTFAKFQTTEEWQKVIKGKAQAFCNDDNAKWFYIGGQVGCGKTHLCSAISAHYIKAGKNFKYMVWVEDSKKLKALANDISYQEEIDVYKNVDVLYIDDFLKVQNGEAPTHADIKLAFEIINRRLLEKDKITIISSERMLNELLDYDEGTISRVHQQAGEYKLNISKDRSKNYRLRG